MGFGRRRQRSKGQDHFLRSKRDFYLPFLVRRCPVSRYIELLKFFRRLVCLIERLIGVTHTSDVLLVLAQRQRICLIESGWENAMPSRLSATFIAAQRAFAAGEYSSARRSASRVQKKIMNNLAVRSFGIPNHSAAHSIVIVLYYNKDAVGEALSSLAACIDEIDAELILLNNGDHTPDVVPSRLRDFVWVDIGFNYGCSGARNVGAQIATGRNIIFLDDDGIVASGSLKALVKTAEQYDAVVVRGKVLPKTTEGIGGLHYCLGEEVICALPNAECISLWRRAEYLAFGGFDTLLAGYEGVALWSKMYRFFGPESFLYSPAAVLRHNYADDHEEADRKRARQAKNLAYLERFYPASQARKPFDAIGQKARNKRTTNKATPILPRPSVQKVSHAGITVITVASNVPPYLGDYWQGLKMQTHGKFEILVLDSSEQQRATENLSRLCEGDDRVRFFEGTGNRAQDLNTAIDRAVNDICAFAEPDDISHPRRLELTARTLMSYPEKACASFSTFSDKSIYDLPLAALSSSIGLRTRSLLGMPICFSALGFRKSRFLVGFDKNAPEECLEPTWYYDNMRKPGLDGIAVPFNLVYRHRT